MVKEGLVTPRSIVAVLSRLTLIQTHTHTHMHKSYSGFANFISICILTNVLASLTSVSGKSFSEKNLIICPLMCPNICFYSFQNLANFIFKNSHMHLHITSISTNSITDTPAAPRIQMRPQASPSNPRTMSSKEREWLEQRAGYSLEMEGGMEG